MSAAASIRNPEFLTILQKSEEKHEPREAVRLFLAGKMNANGLGDLRREIDDARRQRRNVVLDLTEVTLVDRVSVDYLAAVRSNHVRVENCPEYLHRWLTGSAT